MSDPASDCRADRAKRLICRRKTGSVGSGGIFARSGGGGPGRPWKVSVRPPKAFLLTSKNPTDPTDPTEARQRAAEREVGSKSRSRSLPLGIAAARPAPNI